MVSDDARSDLVPVNAVAPLDLQEQRIARAMSSFSHEIGSALLVIQEERLYRAAGYTTFAEYCQERLPFSRQRAYQFINFFKVVRDVSTGVDTPGMALPLTEFQARPLVELKTPERRRAVWKDAVERYGDAPAEPDVREAVDYYWAIMGNPSWRELPRDEVVRRHRAGRTTAEKKRRLLPKPVAKPISLSTTDDVLRWSFNDVRTMVADLSGETLRWLSTLTKPDRRKVNDLIGDLRVLAGALDDALGSVRTKDYAQHEDGGDDVGTE
jgi:hypothetical protein